MHTSEAQGNAALKDKVAALKWVKGEIHKFGGDPNLVTIFGASSGGMSVNLMHLSPMASGLFHRAISHSGAALCSSSYLPSTSIFGLRLAQSLGCPSLKPEAAVACLKAVNGSDLAEKQLMFKGEESRENPFVPSTESALGEEVFLPGPPESLITNASSVPFIFGVTSGEGLMFVDNPNDNPVQFDNIDEEVKKNMPHRFLESADSEKLEEALQQVKELYFKNNSSHKDKIYGLLDFIADGKFTSCITKTAQMISEQAPVYLFYFGYDAAFENNNYSYQLLNLSKVCHGEDLSYIFYRNYTIKEHNNLSAHAEEMSIVDNVVELWTNFAKYGAPTPEMTNHTSFVWKPVKNNFTQHLFIGSNLIMAENPLLKDRMDFWEKLDQNN